MGRIVTLTIKIRFSEKIETDEELQEIVDNVSEALNVHIESVGLAPKNSDAITTRFEVMEQHSGASNKQTFSE